MVLIRRGNMIVAKQMEVRANIREYLDKTYNGEQILIPRKNNRNVVIISAERGILACISAFAHKKSSILF